MLKVRIENLNLQDVEKLNNANLTLHDVWKLEKNKNIKRGTFCGHRKIKYILSNNKEINVSSSEITFTSTMFNK